MGQLSVWQLAYSTQQAGGKETAQGGAVLSDKQAAFTHKPFHTVEGTPSTPQIHSLDLFYPDPHGIS